MHAIPDWQLVAHLRGFRQLDSLHWRTPAGTIVAAEFVRHHCDSAR